MRAIGERMVERQLFHLPRGCFGQARLGKTDTDAPKSRHRLNVALARYILDVNAVAALDDKRTFPLEADSLDIGMVVITDIAGLKKVCVGVYSLILRKDNEFVARFGKSANRKLLKNALRNKPPRDLGNI